MGNSRKNRLIKERKDAIVFNSLTFKQLIRVRNVYAKGAIEEFMTGSPPNSFKKYLKYLDEICLRIEKSEHNKKILLKGKIKGLGSDNYVSGSNFINIPDKDFGKWKNTTHFFAEIKSFDYLKNNGFTNIQFVKTESNKTPDFKAKKGNAVFYIEVKCIDKSQSIIEILRNPKDDSLLELDKDFSKLENKIKLIIEDAKHKFLSINAKNKILLLDYNWGGNNIDERKTLEEIFGTKYLNNLGKKYGIIIKEIPRFRL